MATVVGALVLLYLAREIFIPLAFALTLSFILTPAAALLQRLRLNRTLAVMIVVVTVTAGAGAAGWLMVNQLIDVVNHLPAYRDNIHSKMLGIKSPTSGALGRAAKSVEELGKELTVPDTTAAATPSRPAKAANTVPVPVRIVTPGPNAFVYLRELTAPFLGPIGMTGFVLILTIFVLIKREDLRDRLLRLVGVGQLHATTQALDDATQRISRYLVLQLLVNGLMGVALWGGLEALGVPYAPLWGVLAAILRIVPYVGIFSAFLLPFTLSLAVFDGWRHPALVFVLFFTLETVVANFIEPLLYGAHTGISSLGLLVSTIFWTLLWGYPGLILSTPLTVCVVVLGRYVPHLSFLHVVLGDEAVLTTDVQLYQRLLTMDHDEVRSVVNGFLKDRPLLELYDQVVIPALILAEQDRHSGTLESSRQEFLFLCLTELIAELAEQPVEDGTLAQSPHKERIFVIPVKDEADEIAAVMFGQLLEREGWPVVSFPAGSVQELAVLKPSAGDTICVSALPPFAFAAAIKLCTKLRSAYPETRIVAGIWGFPEDRESLLRRLEKSKLTAVATTLTQGLEKMAPEAAPEISAT